jgi:hypothetical protein
LSIVLDNRHKEQCSVLIWGTMAINNRQWTVLHCLLFFFARDFATAIFQSCFRAQHRIGISQQPLYWLPWKLVESHINMLSRC